MHPIEVNGGETIIRRGEVGECLYLIEQGQVQVQVPTTTGEVLVLATLGPNGYFGEIGLLTGGFRTANVIALTSVKLLQLTSDTYSHYLAHMAEVEKQLALTAATRSSQTMRAIDNSAKEKGQP
jgi:CRP-like cAMP-binding protein